MTVTKYLYLTSILVSFINLVVYVNSFIHMGLNNNMLSA